MERNKIIEELAKEIETLAGKKPESFDEEIFKTGFLDSINVLQIILFMESQFSIEIDTFDLTLDTLGTINRMADYLESKIKE